MRNAPFFRNGGALRLPIRLLRLAVYSISALDRFDLEVRQIDELAIVLSGWITDRLLTATCLNLHGLTCRREPIGQFQR